MKSYNLPRKFAYVDILSLLYESKGVDITIRQISDKLRMTYSWVFKSIKELESVGLVVCTKDGRQMLINLHANQRGYGESASLLLNLFKK